jgi:hypothetical protein
MKVLKQYGIVLLIIVTMVTAVFIKSFSRNTFRYDAVKRAEPSVHKANILSSEQLRQLPGDILWIDMDGAENTATDPNRNTIKIPADSILSKPYIKLIFKHDGNIVLKSDDQYKSAGIWMVLSQMGIKNVYILK